VPRLPWKQWSRQAVREREGVYSPVQGIGAIDFSPVPTLESTVPEHYVPKSEEM